MSCDDLRCVCVGGVFPDKAMQLQRRGGVGRPREKKSPLFFFSFSPPPQEINRGTDRVWVWGGKGDVSGSPQGMTVTGRDKERKDPPTYPGSLRKAGSILILSAAALSLLQYYYSLSPPPFSITDAASAPNAAAAAAFFPGIQNRGSFSPARIHPLLS